MAEDEGYSCFIEQATRTPTNFRSWSEVRIALEAACPKLSDSIDIEEIIKDQHWQGLYAIPNCPTTLDVETAINGYKCAVARYSSSAKNVKETKGLKTKLEEFIKVFKQNGGVSLYHWALSEAHRLKDSRSFVLARNSNTGFLMIFDAKRIIPWYMSEMFRAFPSTSIVCHQPCEALLEYNRRKQKVLVEAASLIMKSGDVNPGISHVKTQLTTEDLRQRANRWRQTAKLVEKDLRKRALAGEDIWLDIFPGFTK